VFEKSARQSPMGRIPTVDDVANAVFYLACEATGVTAHTLIVDCGVTALQPVV
jgi:NAD(P)-dependent dehydrogenase (short-subunit alcohol dehydrogenase family)